MRDQIIARLCFTKIVDIVTIQLHGFCDTSEVAYAGVVYLRTTDSKNNVHVSLVMAKTKVALIKWLTIPRLELCSGALLSKLLNHGPINMQAHPSFKNLVLFWTPVPLEDMRIILHMD